MNKVSRVVVLETLIDATYDTIDKLYKTKGHWDVLDGSVAPQVAAHLSREMTRQEARLTKLRTDLAELLKVLPSGWRCGARDAAAWGCVLHVGHRGEHRYNARSTISEAP